MNHVNLIGKISSEPKIYDLPNGRKVAQFTMSTLETYLNEKGETKQRNHWHRMSAWGRWVAVMNEFGNIGLDLAVEGKLTTRFFQKNGIKNCISEVEINDLVIL